MPIGMPGWPMLAFCTASIDRARMAFAMGARRAGSRLMQGLRGNVGIGRDSAARSVGSVLRTGKLAPSRHGTWPGPAWVKVYSQLRQPSFCRTRLFKVNAAPMDGERISRALARIEA